jgi:hypothetical protein
MRADIILSDIKPHELPDVCETFGTVQVENMAMGRFTVKVGWREFRFRHDLRFIGISLNHLADHLDLPESQRALDAEVPA